MTILVPILGDQLSHDLASLRAAGRGEAVVVMAEVAEEAGYVAHHKQKLALVFSAMRHFADELREAGWTVDYQQLDEEAPAASLTEALARAARRHGASRVVAVCGGEHRVIALQQRWGERLGLAVTLLEDDRFLVGMDAFAHWAEGRKLLRMEDFYRWQRRQTGILMAGEQPAGGQWNFDADNRKALPAGLTPPPVPTFAPDGITREVLAMVGRRFPANFGRLEGFGWPVTRAQALAALDAFVRSRLALFGDYQDALSDGEDTLFHSLLSTSLNLGLLNPREVIEAAAAALETQGAPLNAVEGFVRQILGWREYVRGIYLREGPDYVERNALDAQRKLPDFYWTGDSGMRCLDRAVAQTRERAYAHHIQRLMVLGNFALIAGVRPHEIHEWFLIVYADAYEWVEAPNVIGMSQYADGGLLASKPYAGGAAYIDRMGDHCRHCRYSPKWQGDAKGSGREPCPFTFLYWDFIARHAERFASNPRMRRAVDGWARFDSGRRRAIRARASAYLDSIG